MDKSKPFKNFAFISYSHTDKKAAEELQNVLDEFELSDTLKEKYPDRPEVLREIFRDDTGLPAGNNLTVEIQKQLSQSNYLIVICSPNAVKSEWVNKEIDYFKTHRDSTHIIPFIIDGIANAKSDDDQECFPSALKSLEARGANVSTFSFERAVIEVIAGALEIDVDDLWQRHVRKEEERKRKLQEQRDNLLRIQSRFLAEKANMLVNEGDSFTARLLALEALPKNMENPDRPYVPEAEMVLRKAIISEFTICKGHNSYVKSVCFSSDGKFFVSASDDDQVIIWNARRGRPIIGKDVAIHGKYAQFSHNGQQIATIDSFGHAYIWDSKSYSKLFEFSGFSFISYSWDDQFVVTSGKDSCVNIWSTSKKQFVSLQGHQDRVTHAVFSPNNQWVVSSSFDKTIRIWDFHTRETLHILKGHSDIVWRIAISPDSQFVASVSDDKTIKVWSIPFGKLLTTYNGHNKRVNSLAFSPDGSKLASVSSDGVAIIWDLVKECSIYHLDGRKWKADPFMFPVIEDRNSIYDVAFSPDGKSIVTSHQDETIRIWNLSSFMFNTTFQGHNRSVNSISFSPDDDHIVSASSDLTIKVWDIKRGLSIMTLLGHNSFISSVEYSPDGQHIVSSSADKTIKIWNAKTGKIIHTLEGHNDFVRYANYSPDGKFIVSASRDTTIKIWDSETGALINTLYGHTAEVSFVSFSHNGKMIVSSSDDNTIIVWDINGGKPIRILKGHTRYIYSAYFCHDDTAIFSCSLDNSIRVWDLQSGQTISKIDGDTRYIYSAMLSPDEKYIVSSAHGNDLKVWDSKSGTLLMSLEGHESQVNAARFSNHGDTIASCSDDKTIRIWQFPPLQQLINDTILQLKQSPLSPEERKKYYLD